jgi:hypothetical protein
MAIKILSQEKIEPQGQFHPIAQMHPIIASLHLPQQPHELKSEC